MDNDNDEYHDAVAMQPPPGMAAALNIGPGGIPLGGIAGEPVGGIMPLQKKSSDYVKSK